MGTKTAERRYPGRTQQEIYTALEARLRAKMEDHGVAVRCDAGRCMIEVPEKGGVKGEVAVVGDTARVRLEHTLLSTPLAMLAMTFIERAMGTLFD